jgi:predicted PurR-regulated permease PerM
MRKGKWVWALLASAAIFIMYRIKGAAAPFFLSLFLALFLKPVVDFLDRQRQVPRSIAILLSYIVMGLLIGAFFFFALPALIKELELAAAELPKQLEAGERLLGKILTKVRWQMPKSMQGALDQSLARFEELTLAGLHRGLNFLVSLIMKLPSLILVPVLTFYFLRDWRALRTGFLATLPYNWRRELLGLSQEVGDVLVAFVRGEALVCLTVGAMAGIGLYFLKIPFALSLGLLIGLLDFIPFLGPVAGGLPAVLLGLAQSPLKAVYVLLLLLAINQVEGACISPRIMGQKVGLHPLLIIFSLLAGGELFGFLGIVIAVPLAAVLKVLGKFLWRRFRLWFA